MTFVDCAEGHQLPN